MYKRSAASALAVLSIGIVSLISAAHAHAAEGSGVYVGIGLGQATNEIDEIGFDESASAYQLFAGYSFNRYISAEISFIDVDKLAADVGATRLTIDSEGFTPSVLGKLPLGSWFSLFARVGYTFSETVVTGTTNGQFATETSKEEDLAVGLGATANFGAHFGVRLEYEVVNTTGGDFFITSLNALYRF